MYIYWKSLYYRGHLILRSYEIVVFYLLHD